MTITLFEGCKDGDTRTSTAFYAQEPAASLKHDEWEVVKVTGESRIRGHDGKPDADCRTVAILDAMRKLAMKSNPGGWDTLALDDTIACDWQLDGLRIKSATVMKSGIVVSDEVDLSLRQKAGQWSSRNLRLIRPDKGIEHNLEKLTGELESRGVNIARSYNIGSDIWREELVIRRRIEG